MPNPDPSPETRFQRGREKTGGRKKGTLNRPKSIKVAMREFTDEKGGELLNWAEALINGPNFVMVGDKVVNLTPVKVTLFRYALEYGIGTPNKQIQDGGHHTLTIAPRYPLGVDPAAMRQSSRPRSRLRGCALRRRRRKACARAWPGRLARGRCRRS